MEKWTSTAKKCVIFGVLSAALLLGALFRASRHEPVFSIGTATERSGLEIKPSFSPCGLPLSSDQTSGSTEALSSSDEKGTGAPRETSSAEIAKKSLQKAAEPGNMETLKKGIHPVQGTPGDMKEYLDEVERTRADRIRKSLRDVQKKVREWERSIFEPTW